jgi:hypothetical protein
VGVQGSATSALSGAVPPLAEGYQPRPESGLGIADGLRPGQTIVLTPDGEPGPGQYSTGGTGKTQLAIAFAHSVWRARQVDLLIWVPAASRDAIVSRFAWAAGAIGDGGSRAGPRVSGAGPGSDPGDSADLAAERFIGWLASERRPWAVILDDLADPSDMDGLWPRGPAGQVLVTTRLPPVVLPGDPATAPVGGFTSRESLAYLADRFADRSEQRIEAPDLATDLAGNPLSLAQAAAVMNDREIGCREIRVELAERLPHMSTIAADGCTPAMLGIWSMAVEHAHALHPVGLAWPALELIALLDPRGIPGSVLTSPAACAYVTGRTSVDRETDLVQAAVTNLARLSLLTVDAGSTARTVRMHPAVRAAVRSYTAPHDLERAAAAAAAALLEAWPANGTDRALAQALRDCTSSLRTATGDLLWRPGTRPLLMRAGVSLTDDGLIGSAVSYWQSMVAAGTRLLGAGHPNVISYSEHLGAAQASARRLAEAGPAQSAKPRTRTVIPRR